MKILILHIPVIHNGYIKLFKKYNNKINKLYVLDSGILSKLNTVQEIRAIPPYKIIQVINALGFSFRAQLLTEKILKKLSKKEIIVTKDFISKKFIKKYFPKSKVNYETVFLRWDEKTIQSPTLPSSDLESSNKFDQMMMRKAVKMGEDSSDWWRRVGAIVVKNKKIIIKAYNEYLPSEHDPYINGNPRDFIKPGTLGFLATSVHAEQSAVAKACKLGKSLKGADMYVSTYPCPTCAKLIALAGIKRCFFVGGNAYLNVEEVFKSTGMKTVLVKGI